jgi:predicted tellurium resistance membrane protein TerC
MKNKVKAPTKKNQISILYPKCIQSIICRYTISFDNVIGVVAAAKEYFGFMIFGLVLSVVLTGALATYMANYIQKHIWIAYMGLIFILIVGLQLIIGGLVDLEILNINEEFKKYF